MEYFIQVDIDIDIDIDITHSLFSREESPHESPSDSCRLCRTEAVLEASEAVSVSAAATVTRSSRIYSFTGTRASVRRRASRTRRTTCATRARATCSICTRRTTTRRSRSASTSRTPLGAFSPGRRMACRTSVRSSKFWAGEEEWRCSRRFQWTTIYYQ